MTYTTDNPIQVLVAAFKNEQGANEALQTLKAAKREQLIGIKNAAILRRDSKNKLHIQALKDMKAKQGAAWGGALGAAVGLLAGPTILAAGATGAVIGALASKLRKSGFSDDRLKQLGEALQPGTSAIIAVIEHKWVGEIEAALAEAGADIVTEALKQDIAQQLETGREVAYTVIASESGLAGGRLAGGESGVEISGFMADDEELLAGDLTIAPDAEDAADSTPLEVTGSTVEA